MKRYYRILFVLHLFVGIGALFGGLAAMLDPEEPLGVTVDALQGSPFPDFLIPGLILFAVIGLGNIFSAWTIVYKPKYQGYTSSVFSWALMIWIAVQCIILETVVFLHVFYFIIGFVGAVLAMLILLNHWKKI